MQYAQLNNGQSMPMLGLGTYTLTGKRGVDIMLDALELGYRLLDTAKMYGNEREVGEAFRKSGLGREELFVTSKLNSPCASYALAKRGISQSLEPCRWTTWTSCWCTSPTRGQRRCTRP